MRVRLLTGCCHCLQLRGQQAHCKHDAHATRREYNSLAKPCAPQQVINTTGSCRECCAFPSCWLHRLMQGSCHPHLRLHLSLLPLGNLCMQNTAHRDRSVWPCKQLSVTFQKDSYEMMGGYEQRVLRGTA
jgi:hypothetical protein